MPQVNGVNAQNNYLGTTNIAYSPTTLANSLITVSCKKIEMALQSSYVGKQYIDNTSSNDRSLASYFVNNLRINYALQNVLSLKEIGFQSGTQQSFQRTILVERLCMVQFLPRQQPRKRPALLAAGRIQLSGGYHRQVLMKN